MPSVCLRELLAHVACSCPPLGGWRGHYGCHLGSYPSTEYDHEEYDKLTAGGGYFTGQYPSVPCNKLQETMALVRAFCYTALYA